MKITVKEALSIGGLASAIVAAGAGNLDNCIESATTIEVTDETIGDWVDPNTLCITAMYSIKDDLESQLRLVRILNAKGCACLVVCHVGIWVKGLAGELVALCDELGFPLIIAESNITYVEILYPLISLLMSDQRDNGLPYTDIGSELVDMIIDMGNVEEVFKKISLRFRGRITYLDSYCNCLFTDKNVQDMLNDKAYIQENLHALLPKLLKERYAIKEDAPKSAIIFLVQTKHNVLGFLIIEQIPGETEAEALRYAETLSTVCALLSGRKTWMSQMSEHYADEYVTDLLIWNFRSEEIAIKRGKEFGINLENKNTFAVINLNDFQRVDTAQDLKNIKDSFIQNTLSPVMRLCTAFDAACAVIFRSDQVLVIADGKGRKIEFERTIAKCVELVAKSGISVSAGISEDFFALSGVPQAYNQAARAMATGRKYIGENHVVLYRSIYFIEMLHSLRKDVAALSAARSYLDALQDYDKAHSSELTHTLSMIIECNNDISAASEKLHIHRNTLLYRKNKITKILGYSPFEMPNLLNVMMALEVVGNELTRGNKT